MLVLDRRHLRHLGRPVDILTVPTPRDILAHVFGYSAFRGEQQAIVEHVTAGGDALVLMPTGGGKSLCYQIPALCRDGFGVVISPLIALMQDQVGALRELGVRAFAINSAQNGGDRRAAEQAMRRGEIDLLYIAPERLFAEGFLDLLQDCRISLFAIDEAHCVSQWGHDFRPEYLRLSVLAQRFPGVPRMAVTATADRATRRDILERLNLDAARVFVASFDRPNIQYRITPKIAERRQLKDFLAEQDRGATGIVYCLSRSRTEAIAEWLCEQGYDAIPYHAGLDPEVRQRALERFVRDDGVIVVATIAFGLGINRPDVRFVAHLDLPKSLEAYYQETGRAGRDGEPSVVWMVYGAEDIAKIRSFIEGSEAPDEQKRVERRKLDALLGFCETAECRRQVLLRYFGEERAAPCGNCDRCLAPVESYDGTVEAQKLLSTIYRTGQRFGAGHVIDVLRGKDSDKIRRFGHDTLTVFGVGSERDDIQWRSVIRQLSAMGLVATDFEAYGALTLGPEVRDVLRGERRVMLTREPSRKERRRTAAPERAARRAEVAEADKPLFEALRQWRRRHAEARGVPPYVICHDATLREIAARRPQSLADLADIPGIGDAKLAQYGEALVGVVSASTSG